MSNSMKIAPALKPRSSIASRITDTMVFMPMHGGGTASIAVNGVTRGLTTTVTLASAYTGIVGQTVKLASLAGITQLNGYAKVIALAPSNGVVLEVDSSAYSAWTSGGNMTFATISDVMGNLLPQDIQGTVTGIWANQGDGLTAHTSGSYTNLITTGLTAFDLSAFRGYLALAFDVYLGAVPSATEQIFALGVQTASGSNTAAGSIQASIESTGLIQCGFRPKTTADGGGTNTFFNTTSAAIGTAAQHHVAFVFDFTSSPSSAIAHTFVDGVLKSSTSLTMTNAIDNPGNTVGLAIGAQISTALALQNKLGASVTPSNARIENLLWWKSSKDFATTVEAVRRFGNSGELNELMV